MSAKYKHAKLLNALHDMQKSVAYAVRRDVLSQAEAVIADYERVESLQQARIAQLEEELRRSVTNAALSGQEVLNDMYVVFGQMRADPEVKILPDYWHERLEPLVFKPHFVGVDMGMVGGDFTGYACSCGELRVSTDGPCKRTDCPIPPCLPSSRKAT